MSSQLPRFKLRGSWVAEKVSGSECHCDREIVYFTHLVSEDFPPNSSLSLFVPTMSPANGYMGKKCA